MSKLLLFKEIENYTKVFWRLAKVMADTKNDFNRKTLIEITKMDIEKIKLLCRLGNLKYINYNLLPEHHIEILNESPEKQEEYLKLAETEQLKPSQLRKVIREKNKKITSQDNKTKVNNFAKCMILLENELKGMDNQTRVRALSAVTNSILKIK